jgi:hypothetical protein
MRRMLGVGVVLLALGLLPTTLSGQSSEPGRRPHIQLSQNYPNPFNPKTTIGFDLSEELFSSGRPVVVTIRIYNPLQQLVAIPKSLDHPGGEQLVLHLEYPTWGHFEAYWDGTDKSGTKVASGVYYCRLEVNGERAPPLKMVVSK